MERQPAHRVHEQELAERRAAAREPLQVHRRLHVHERQRDELREAAARLLLLAHAEQVPRPVHRAVDVAEHDRVVRAEAQPVRRVVHLEPLVGRHLVGADDTSYLVVQHLRRRPRQRGEALVAQQLQVVGERQAERRRALPDLERRERVDVDAGHRVLDRPHDREVVVAVERRVNTALEADLDGAALPCLLDAPHDLVHGQEIRRPAEVLGELPLRERAEAALEVADVRVLDVPRDDVRDGVAVQLASQAVGGCEDTVALAAPGAEQPHDLLLAELVARVDRAARRGERTGSALRRPASTRLRAPGRPNRPPGARAASPSDRSRPSRRTPGRRAAARRARARPRASPPRAARARATAPPG